MIKPRLPRHSHARVALLIDAENASSRYCEDYVQRAAELGKVTIMRCYGGPTSLKKWDTAMKAFHIRPMATPPVADKANASDFALTIDAVALLHQGLLDCAVVASSDQDFVQLALHVREQGAGIHGIGERKSPLSYRGSFDTFTIIPPPSRKKEEVALPPAPEPKERAVAAKTPDDKPVRRRPWLEEPLPPHHLDVLLEIFHEIAHDGKANARHFSSHLTKRLGADYRRGFGTMSRYLAQSGLFKISRNAIRLLDEPKA